MKISEVMTRDVITAAPDDPVMHVAGLLTEHRFAAVPVVDDGGALVGIAAEADIIRDRMPADPRLHLRRDEQTAAAPPGGSVAEVMTTRVRFVDARDDVSDVAALLLHERLRSVPVLDRGRLVGMVSRRDLLRVLVRPDEAIVEDLRRLIEEYTGEADGWDVRLHAGKATVRRTSGRPDSVEVQAIGALARTVVGVVGVEVTGGDVTGAG